MRRTRHGTTAAWGLRGDRQSGISQERVSSQGSGTATAWKLFGAASVSAGVYSVSIMCAASSSFYFFQNLFLSICLSTPFFNHSIFAGGFLVNTKSSTPVARASSPPSFYANSNQPCSNRHTYWKKKNKTKNIFKCDVNNRGKTKTVFFPLPDGGEAARSIH